jgi:hypothetical protein
VIDFFGFFALAKSSLAFSRSALSGSHSDFGLIVSKPGIPFGVNPVEGTWPPWETLSTITRRSTAMAMARRWLTSLMFLTLRP